MRLSELAANVLDVVPVRRRRQLTVADALANMSWTRDIRGALTIPVLVHYVFLYQRLQVIQLSPSVPDQLEWRWSASGLYSSHSAYATLLLGQSSVLGARNFGKLGHPTSVSSLFGWYSWTDAGRRSHYSGMVFAQVAPASFAAKGWNRLIT
jgi:hypothetical protein